MPVVLFQVYRLAPSPHLEAIYCHQLPLRINTIAQEHPHYQEAIQYQAQVLELVWEFHPRSPPLVVEEGHLQQPSATLQSRLCLLQNVTVKGNLLQHLIRFLRNGGHHL
jgi:hypothetical protein